MPRAVAYFYSVLSPWAYIGHAPFMDLVVRHGVTLEHRPMALGNVFADTGGLPLARRHPARQHYRAVELQRWRARRGLEFHLKPRYWPFDSKLADRVVVAIVSAGHDPDGFLRRAFAGIWTGERDLADEATLVDIVTECGLDGASLLDSAKSDDSEARYVQNYRDAVAGEVFGSPAYVLDGEVFWGQDRLDLLDDALTSGRPPFRPFA
jgi:2-hydroxychromene-2-carboxylate isomerase